MAEEVLIPEITKKKMYCPFCKSETVHVYDGKSWCYSLWRCKVCGKVILGEPIQKFRKAPTFSSKK